MRLCFATYARVKENLGKFLSNALSRVEHFGPELREGLKMRPGWAREGVTQGLAVVFRNIGNMLAAVC